MTIFIGPNHLTDAIKDFFAKFPDLYKSTSKRTPEEDRQRWLKKHYPEGKVFHIEYLVSVNNENAIEVEI